MEQSTNPPPTEVNERTTDSVEVDRLSQASDRSTRQYLGAIVGELSYRYALIFVWIGVAIFFSIVRPSTFATTGNLNTIFASQSVLALVALALVFPLIVGEFDLSIGATLGLSAILIAVLNVQYHWPIGLAVVAALAVGVIVGSVNGFFVVIVGVNALVCTLGISTLVTGVGFAVSNYVIISGIAQPLVTVVTQPVFGLPLSFYYGVAVAAIVWYLLRYTPLGRHLIFVGASREVARLSGLPVQRMRVGAFVVCGLLASVAGVLLSGTLGGEDPNAGNGYLLPAYSAAFLGATVVNPGQFNPWGTLIAVYFLVTGITGLQLLGISDWIQQVFYGSTLVIAITLSHLAAKRRV